MSGGSDRRNFSSKNARSEFMEPSIEVKHVTKIYGDKPVVNDLSFTARQGELLGLIGPNGAGKTTTIRMMMDIIKPDTGAIMLFGQKLNEEMKNKLGYLPEERGLYQKSRVIDSIIYLSSLKGLDAHSAVKRAEKLLDRAGLLTSLHKKTEELSKGMGQMVQFIVTVIHDPQLIIMDEPFSGLDPVNTELLKSILLDLRNEGKAIILSTHQMSQVEELCDRVVMVNHGRAVLYGGLREIKSQYRSNTVFVDYEGDAIDLTGVTEKRLRKTYQELVLDDKTEPRQILAQLVASGRVVNRFEVGAPSLNEIFIKVAGKNEK
jgi:ABC-2 type transport system ATP-binding protein